MEQMPNSWDGEEIESLILSLYTPASPEVISTTQRALSKFQHSPQAWQIVHRLLERPDEKVQFFGALTIIVKLNKDGARFGEEEALALLEHLFCWLTESLGRGTTALVPRKLASAIGTFFLHYHALWPNSTYHLAVFLASHTFHHPRALSDPENLASTCEKLLDKSTQAVIWVITSIMEDVVRTEWNSTKNFALYSAAVSQALDAATVLSNCLGRQDLPVTVFDDAVKCLQACIGFVQRASPNDCHLLMPAIRRLIPAVVHALGDECRFEISSEFLIDVLNAYPSLFTDDHLDALANLIASPWCDSRYHNLLQGGFEFQSLQIGHLILAFSEAKMDWLMRSSDPRRDNIMQKLCGLLTAIGQPVVEDTIFVPTVEFWSVLTEEMADTIHSDDLSATPWAESALHFVMAAVASSWQKIAYPTPEELAQWDSAERAGFSDARKDVVDLLQSTYSLSGIRLVSTFANIVLASLTQSKWLELEAAAFCLGGLSDSARDDPLLFQTLDPLFNSSLFSDMTSAAIPSRTRQTCVTLIEKYTDYFEEHFSSLLSALRLLFNLLGDEPMAVSASKSIFRLCSSCRTHIHTEATGFLGEYQALSRQRKLDCIASEKVLGAIACVAQAIPNRSEQCDVYARLLDCIEADVLLAEALMADPDLSNVPCLSRTCYTNDSDTEHPALHVALKAMRCLVSVGKGSQVPLEAAIELDRANRGRMGDTEETSALHRRILSIVIGVENLFGSSTEVMELVCAALRCGFSETEAGPFVLPPRDVTAYLTKHQGKLTRPGILVAAACAFMSGLHSRDVPDKAEMLETLLTWVIELLKSLPVPEDDPELTQNGLDFASRLFVKVPGTLLHLQPQSIVEFLFIFAIQVLDGSEPLSKGAATEFWATFITLKVDDGEVNEATTHAMDTLGPLLATSLARNIGGRASRSELDKLSEPVKKLIQRFPKAKAWVQAGLDDASFPSDKVSSEQKTVFVKKLVSLRGSRATNQLIREFWLSARGSNFAYAS